MSSRDKILAAVKQSQPELLPLPDVFPLGDKKGELSQYKNVLESIGGKVYTVSTIEEVTKELINIFPEAKRIVSAVTTIEMHLLSDHQNLVHHSLHDVDVAIVKAKLAVAENGAVWVTEDDLKIRVLPFICEHLIAIVDEEAMVANMHQAYQQIAENDYGFGVFIAGPSKTADIEQSLVLGAHGPKTMTVFVLTNS